MARVGVDAGPLDTPGSWTPDGKALAVGRGFPLGGSANSDIFVVSVDRPQEARPAPAGA